MLNIGRVINYDLPETAELFTHRVGRTARIGNSGQAITLMTVVDLPKMQEIERKLGRKLPRVKAPAAVAAPPPGKTISRRPAPPVTRAAPVATTTASTTDATDAPKKRRRRRRRPAESAPVLAPS